MSTVCIYQWKIGDRYYCSHDIYDIFKIVITTSLKPTSKNMKKEVDI